MKKVSFTWSRSGHGLNRQLEKDLCWFVTHRAGGGRGGGCGGHQLREEGGSDDGDPDLHHEHLEPAAPEHVEPDLDDGGDSALPGVLLASSEVAAQIFTWKNKIKSRRKREVKSYLLLSLSSVAMVLLVSPSFSSPPTPGTALSPEVLNFFQSSRI